MKQFLFEALLALGMMSNPESADYNPETALSAIQEIGYEMHVEDVDSDLLSYLGTTQVDSRLLAQITFTESNLEVAQGEQLVVHTILNRLNNGYWGDTIERVIFAPHQFDGVRLDSFGEYNGENLRNVLLVIYKRKFEPDKLSATERQIEYFHNPEIINTKSYAKKNKLVVMVTVGNHVFLRKR